MQDSETAAPTMAWPRPGVSGLWLGLLAAVICFPAILQLEQLALPDLHLVQGFQWIVDAWRQLLASAGAALDAAGDALNSRFGWRLSLAPVWLPIFAISAVLVLVVACASWRRGRRLAVVLWTPAGLVSVFCGAVGAGLAASSAGLAGHMVIAASPPLALLGWMTCALARSLETDNGADARSTLRAGAAGTAMVCACAIVLTAIFANIPVLAASPGLAALACVALLLGLAHIAVGLEGGNRGFVRVGSAIVLLLGAPGFLLAVNAIARALGAPF
jgi:hypothetical protein